jgi:PAS domain S-box-containing protein
MGRTASQESADYFRSILKNSQVAITVVDAEGNLTLFSQGAEKLTGYPAREVLGKPLSTFYPEIEALKSMQAALSEKGKI